MILYLNTIQWGFYCFTTPKDTLLLGFWLLNYCEEHDVKIELILEPYDVSTANGEMIFGMNLVFGQRERKEIGARTKRAMEEMALEKIHPSKAPFGYVRNKDTGHLEIEPIEAQVVKEIFKLCQEGNSTRGIATIMKDNNAYLKSGKWKADRVYKILTNSIYKLQPAASNGVLIGITQ